MGAKVTAHADTRLIEITEAPSSGFVTLDVVTDIYSDLKEDWLTDPLLQVLRFPLRSFGDPIGAQQIGPYVFLNNLAGWRMQPYDADHEVNLIGNLIPESAVQGKTVPLWVSRPGRTIIIPSDRSAQALTNEVEVGSGLSAEQAQQLLELYKRQSLDPNDPFTATPTRMRTASGDIIIDLSGDGKNITTGTRQP